MVKQIIIEEQGLEYLRKHADQEHCIAGLIVGSTSPNKDYIADLIKCPAQMIDDTATKWETVRDVDGSWVAGHAAQIISSLPGGVNIIGLFLTATSADNKQATEKLKHMAYQTYKLISKTASEIDYPFTSACGDSYFWTTLHVDMKTGAVITSRQYDMKDNKDIGRPVDLKQNKMPSQWDCLETTICVDMLYETSPKIDGHGSALKLCLKDFCDSVLNSVISIENRQRLNEEVLNQSSTNTGKVTKKQKSTAKLCSSKKYTCQIYIPSKTGVSSYEIDTNQLHLCGNITAKAFIAPFSTVGDATLALKHDIVRSLYQRLDILADDIKYSHSDALCFPRRVYCGTSKTPGSILYSEYILPDEPVEDCLERYRDNLDMNVTAEDLTVEDSVEKFTTLELRSQVSSSDTNNVPEETIGGGNRTNAVIALVTTAVAFLGWVFSGLLLDDN